jgi:uncharacterized protein (TIGR00251 family)
MAMNEWCRPTPDGGVLIDVHVQPNARTTAAVGEHGGALKIKLQAPPVDGLANEALLAWVAARLRVPRRAVSLKSGQASRRKSLLVSAELDAAWAAAALSPVSASE